jgi:hypothetical protein
MNVSDREAALRQRRVHVGAAGASVVLNTNPEADERRWGSRGRHPRGDGDLGVRGLAFGEGALLQGASGDHGGPKNSGGDERQREHVWRRTEKTKPQWER